MRKLKTELDLIRQQNLGMVDSHREELTEFRHELTSGHQLEINSLNETVSRQVLKIKKLKSKVRTAQVANVCGLTLFSGRSKEGSCRGTSARC